MTRRDSSPASVRAGDRRSDAVGTRGHRWAVRLVMSLAIFFLILATATLIVGSFPALQREHTELAKFASFVDWGLLAWGLALLNLLLALLLTRARTVLAVGVLALIGSLIQVSWVAPFYRADPTPSPPGVQLRLLTLNMQFGGADPNQVVTLARQADVVTLVEITPEAIVALREAGLENVLRYRLGEGAPYATGTAIYSRTPVQQLANLDTGFETIIGRVDTQGRSVVVAAVHLSNPLVGVETWAADGAALRAELRPYLRENLVVTGDFNAVNRHATMLDLATDGLTDAADLAGAGLHPTWPLRQLPFPVIAIDHTLLGPTLSAQTFSVQQVDNSDHAALLVTVGVGRK